MSSIRVPIILGIVALTWVTTGAGQQRFFPAVRSFELPEASPRVHGFVGPAPVRRAR